MATAEAPFRIDGASVERIPLLGLHKATIYSAEPGNKLIVTDLLAHPEDFHGDPHVDHVVDFGSTYEGLIGESDNSWRHNEQGIVVLEEHSNGARTTMDRISELAKRLIADPSLYDDVRFCEEYALLSRIGYGTLKEYENDFGLSLRGAVPVSLVRAGLVTTRQAFSEDQDARLKDEVRVVTKRFHLKGASPTDLAVTVTFEDRGAIAQQLNKQPIVVPDFVNPASGASTMALVLAARLNGAVPSRVDHRAICATEQGMAFTRALLRELGIDSTFYSLGVETRLNDHYYLEGNRPVGDAGDVLRHFLPAWYK